VSAVEPTSDAEAGYPSPGRAWWTVSVLVLLGVFSYLDRQIIALLIDPIRHALHITDFQASLLHGLAFVIFYVVFGLGFGWAVDRFSRRWVVFAGLVTWSIAASACGLARSFTQLFVFRFGVGAGEAALAPASYSLISDSFPKHKLALPLSIFGGASALGGAASLGLGSLLLAVIPQAGLTLPVVGHLDAWQAVLLATGAPCLLVSWLVFTMVEPVRRGRASRETAQGAAPGRMIDAWRFMASKPRFFVGHFLGVGVMSMSGYGLVGWLPTYAHRHFGVPMGQVGVAIAASAALACLIAPPVTGAIVDRWFQRGCKDAHLRFLIILGVLQILTVIGIVMAPNFLTCLVFAFLINVFGPFMGPASASLQIVTPNEFRGQVSSVYLLVYSLLGLGAGPAVVGYFTTYVYRSDAAVGWSMLTSFLVFMPFCLGLLAWACKPMREAVAAGD
jgi:MFS family permease